MNIRLRNFVEIYAQKHKPKKDFNIREWLDFQKLENEKFHRKNITKIHE